MTSSMLTSAQESTATSTLADPITGHPENHGFLPCLNTRPETPFTQPFTSKNTSKSYSGPDYLDQDPVVELSTFDSFLRVPGEPLKIHMKRLNLALQLLQALRHKQVLNSSITTKMLRFPLINTGTVINLRFRRTDTKITAKQPGHRIITFNS